MQEPPGIRTAAPLGEVKRKLWFDERVDKLSMERFIEVLEPGRESLRFLDFYWEHPDTSGRDTPTGLRPFPLLETLILGMARLCPEITWVDGKSILQFPRCFPRRSAPFSSSPSDQTTPTKSCTISPRESLKGPVLKGS